MEKIIIYFGQNAKVACDEMCNKAWGINNRPNEQLSDDEDDTVMLADGELGEAPEHPGTYEGGDAKPIDKVGIPNKWCVRECERCAKSKPGEYKKHLPLKDFSKRIYNQPWKHPGTELTIKEK
jgi:hypothetical protein